MAGIENGNAHLLAFPCRILYHRVRTLKETIMSESIDNLRNRRALLASYLERQGITAAFFRDAEGARDPAIRYFTGQPGDSVLLIAATGWTALSPWDENMADLMADADVIVPYTAFGRDHIRAASELSKLMGETGGKIEIPPSTSYPDFLKYVDAIQDWTIICRGSDGTHKFVVEMRAVKDDDEIKKLRKACAITDRIIEMIVSGAKSGAIKTEVDAMLLIERETRLNGAEGAGFDTLAAGPSRSFGIHCFPSSTASAFPADGLSILDFGVLYEGYSSDVTMTITKGKLSDAQEKQLALVQKAYGEALGLYKPGVPVREAALKVRSVFAQAKREMPHSLGHGIGLEIHEFPQIRTETDDNVVFKAGMTVTCEPGLYHRQTGGCRLENSILITPDGNETLTKSKIVRL
jgi:Xaa-Pro dipeptidase